jgi:SHAQKYF class myb-like DNA-binding protein
MDESTVAREDESEIDTAVKKTVHEASKALGLDQATAPALPHTEPTAASSHNSSGTIFSNNHTSVGFSMPPEEYEETGRENTGRWSKAEHAAFLKGLEMYGKEWKSIAALVKTRTVMQTRTHAQKYYEKLAKVASNSDSMLGASTRIGNQGPNEAAVLNSQPISSPFKPVSTSSSPVLALSITDEDILVPISLSTAMRTANKEYMDLMKSNCFIFHALATEEQAWLVRNLVHFLTVARERRMIASHPALSDSEPQYHVLTEENAISVVHNDFAMDPLKKAGLDFHRFWLLGEHDPGNAHNGMPFVHRSVDGSWKSVTTGQIREILKGEGLKNLLLLPPTVHLKPSNASNGTQSASDEVDAMNVSLNQGTVDTYMDASQGTTLGWNQGYTCV